MGWLKDGKLKPHVSDIVPLEDATRGLEALATRKSVGKVVIEP
jgi:NADPH2:quinone reductase